MQNPKMQSLGSTWQVKFRKKIVIDVIRQNLAITWMMLVTVESIVVASWFRILIKKPDKFMNHGRIIAFKSSFF
jgi:NitT/TauT family transport system permease protein